MKKYKNLISCQHCGAENPPTAYCCLSCFKVVQGKAKLPFWKVRFEPSWTALAIVMTVFLSIILLLKNWMQNIDAQVTMNLKTAENSYSIVADKKKRNDLNIESSSLPLENPSEETK